MEIEMEKGYTSEFNGEIPEPTLKGFPTYEEFKEMEAKHEEKVREEFKNGTWKEGGDPLKHSDETIEKHEEGMKQVDKEFKEYAFKMMRAKDTKEIREELAERHRKEFEQSSELEDWEKEA